MNRKLWLLLLGVVLADVLAFSGKIVWAQNYPPSSGSNYSASYCEAFARDYAERYSRGGTLQGAGRTAATGSLIGGIAGGWRGARTGAAVGAAVGAVGGTARKAVDYDQLYRAAYDDCRQGYLRN